MITNLFPTKVPNYVMKKWWGGGRYHFPTHVFYAVLELGTKKTHPISNDRISEYFSACGLGELDQNFPWCGAFLVHCFKRAGNQNIYKMPVKNLCNSQRWLEFPEDPDLIPAIGDVVIFTRKD